MDSIREALQPVFEKYRAYIAAAYLHGSTVGEGAPGSEIKLAVLLHDSCSETVLRPDLDADCRRVLKRTEIDIIVLNRTLNMLLLNEIVRNGVVLWESDRSIREEYEVNVVHDFIDFKEHKKRIFEDGLPEQDARNQMKSQ